MQVAQFKIKSLTKQCLFKRTDFLKSLTISLFVHMGGFFILSVGKTDLSMTEQVAT